jgi:hypothetical protein
VICYAIICFGMIFVIQQSLTFAASEGARAALNYAPDLATRTSKRSLPRRPSWAG